MSLTEPEDNTKNLDDDIKVLYSIEELFTSSSEEPPIEEWSSLLIPQKCLLKDMKESGMPQGNAEGLYSPESGEICAKYLQMSASSVIRHPYYNFPCILDPGIKNALFKPEPQRPLYPDDGCKLYVDLCKEHNVPPTRLFYENLLNPEINLRYYCPSSANVRMMAIALQRNNYVKRFDLTHNYLNIDACYHLGQMIKTNTTLEELILDGCRIKEVGLRNLSVEIQRNVAINTLSLANNDLSDEGGQLFAGLIASGANFSKVNLRHNNLGLKTATALYKALEINNILTYLDLSWNYFDLTSIVKMLNTLALTSRSLKELNLSQMGLDNESVAIAIAEVTLIKTLQILNVSNNMFDDTCAKHLIANLQKSSLRTYDLSCNVFTPLGACTILEKLKKPQVKLRNLFLDNICVNRKFMSILENIRKYRKKFVVTFDKVLHDWVAIGEDPRKLILKRGEYMGKMIKKDPKDVPMFLLSLSYAADYIRAKEFVVMMKEQKIPTNDDWVDGLIKAFPGPLIDAKPSVNSSTMREFIKRLWPDLKLPPDWTPPVMIRVDVKRKKVIQKSNTTLVLRKKAAAKKKK